VFLFVGYLPQNGRKRAEHVGALLYEGILLYLTIWHGSCWHKYFKIVLLQGTWIILNTYQFYVEEFNKETSLI